MSACPSLLRHILRPLVSVGLCLSLVANLQANVKVIERDLTQSNLGQSIEYPVIQGQRMLVFMIAEFDTRLSLAINGDRHSNDDHDDLLDGLEAHSDHFKYRVNGTDSAINLTVEESGLLEITPSTFGGDAPTANESGYQLYIVTFPENDQTNRLEINGIVTRESPLNNDGAHTERVDFEIPEDNAVVTVNVTADQNVDSKITIINSAGDQSSNDDFGETHISQTSLRNPSAGTCSLYVTSYNNSQSHRDFNFTATINYSSTNLSDLLGITD